MTSAPDPRDTDPGTWQLIGLDGEMSGADIELGCALIQVGAAAWREEPGGPIDTYSSLIGYPLDNWTADSWQERAQEVHGFTPEQVAAARPAAEVDAEFRTWLLEHGARDGARRIVPVGLNVVAFDLPFFRTALPTATRLIARRGVDLNALLFTFDGWDPSPKGTSVRDFAGWKRSMRHAANKQLDATGLAVREHDAGHDAAQALSGWWWLRSQVTEQTAKVRDLDAALDAADPLRRLGAGLLARLEGNGVTRQEVGEVAAALEQAHPGLVVSRWFGTANPTLGDIPIRVAAAGGWDRIRVAAGVPGA